MSRLKVNEKKLLKIKRYLNPAEWTAHLLGLTKSHGTSVSPGLVMVQIDGFGLTQLHEAIRRHEMPFLEKLLNEQKYNLHSLYPGLPSTTPAVQGELFYGVKQVVPSFFFFDRETQKVFRMFDGDCVREIEGRLSQHGQGLLAGGSSYSNIYNGGAQESHFCAGSLGWNHIWEDVNPLNAILLVLTHVLAVIRMIILVLWELILAVMDFIYGLLKRESVVVEFKFVFLRVMLCILLRELITLGARVDVVRGLPIVHLNFIGYDEQAHRRGPGSQTAHWALKGIDKAISRIYFSAIHSSRRNYDVWIYSDHGQEKTIPYIWHYRKGVEQAVADIYYKLFPQEQASGFREPKETRKQQEGIQLQRARYLGKWVEKIWPLNQPAAEVSGREIIVAAMGPVGGIYVSRELNREDTFRFARELVQSANIPLVLMPEENGKARAWNEHGEFILPDDGAQILGANHPFYDDAVKDLVSLCHHENAGTLTISGWKKDSEAFSFPFENGAHAGPGKEETSAFALLPADIQLPSRERKYLKIQDLRKLALNFLKRAPQPEGNSFAVNARHNIARPPGTVRLMTYNVHSCVGMDSKVSPERIARVIGRYQPDIVALQELDIRRQRTNHLDQPHVIAKELEMMYHFHPSIEVAEEQYGNAVLSRFPMDLVSAMKLPKLESKIDLEPRGAIWVSVDVGGVRLQIINTHLSFYSPECQYQAKALVSPEWIGHPNCAAPAILCGDFNCLPHSVAWRTINSHLRDAQHLLNGHRPLATWFGHRPVGRIDHVFVTPQVKVVAVEVPKTHLDKMASDHLPLIVDLEIS